jgi:integrase
VPALSFVLSEFLEHSGSRGLEPATMKSYEYYANRFLGATLGERLVTDLVHQDLEQLYREMEAAGYAISSIRKCHVTARRAMKYAKREGWVQRNVAEDAEVPRSRDSGVDVPTAEEVKRLLSVAAQHDRFVHDYAHTIAHTGVGPGEACGLKAEDLDGLVLTVARSIDVCRGAARIKRLKSARRVIVDERTANILLNRGEWVFGGSEPGRTDLASKKFKRLATRVNLGHITPRSLRHFYAVTLLSNKVPAHVISNSMGYRSPDGFLRVYSRFVPSPDVVAPEIIRYALR